MTPSGGNFTTGADLPTTILDTLQDLATETAPLVVSAAVASSLVSCMVSVLLSMAPTVASSATTVAGSAPMGDLFSFWLLLDYLQFLASSGHMEMPSAPPFYHDFTDSLSWTVLTVPPTWSPRPPEPASLAIARGDIIAGVLAYAQRLSIHPETLFAATAVGFGCVVGAVVVVVSVLYGAIRLCFAARLRRVKAKLKAEIPQDRLFLRLLLQSALGIALVSEYALSMTASFQLRFADSRALCLATLALTLVCCGLLVLGVCMLYGKSAADLAEPGFKFTWGGYYKTYSFEHRYFFVAKMGAEIGSGVIIGAVSDVPTQLTLLLSLQLVMFLYTTHCNPYLLDFQNVCASAAFVMKMVTYALLSSFVSATADSDVANIVGTAALVLQVTLLLLFNSRQLYIITKQATCLWHRVRRMRKARRQAKEDAIVAEQLRRDSFVQTCEQMHRASL
ncbi:hypothetical protein ACHHYP_08225 [Achlya hypogyna]|uniref:TRP C-terminal domain-containing protein n=1 Tax=Achlya hypogyna TaxID=1202772 RepID=A0A1V9ZL10_ACHHY|nr:hypothetical protein ACHHYP_08225 [Achlya hypogyna]